ncbi:1,2-phenylacetyl-CoA epoxidase subunit PaaC [Glaciibacter psychrotolerans]|uniref:Ring-1,2-phenylacetyl-CoA epoxidase subunit PaaC n=1 Tax=Glaciibacter psychrotolerans TaxID=670054 RepID=A0A7Z0EFH2_9MICO|nr:1,2-phenylacetyl-CoA epoxidase subunit PaaC [Leifsonia psychrotolerans]NYJ20550.1 ring-1,2-phenylacetyl-CoA epoxidase subunit PaaC [Leifsonia psychrotolerans]
MSAPVSHLSDRAVVTPESIADRVSQSTLVASDAVAEYALGLGDDALILAHRLGEWIANAPELEEDVALGNIGLDLLGHARSLLTYAGSAGGHSEDDLAYFRGESEFRCRQLFEQPIGDFGQTIARQFIASIYFDLLYRQLVGSTDEMLAAIAAKAVKEVDYHLDHSIQWLLRLGLGTEESRFRMQRGLDAMWPFVDELFRSDAGVAGVDAAAGADSARSDTVRSDSAQGDPTALVGIAADLEGMRAEFETRSVWHIEQAGLSVPRTPPARGGGRRGVHSEAFGPLLAEMQVLARAHPGASW